ncbi:MAG: tRNA (guanosine(46)-N7)-methyltransferase TrmB [Bacteroidales bacterium]|nr:tRNA (guanosine(46)-N7)-methyltransferase TrmB [Bacteroidales bacterium]
MVGKDKLKRFAETKTFINFLQPTIDEVQNDYYLKGKWVQNFFKNSNPIILELGCGKGEYTTGLARKYPSINFIGIDRKGARMWRGAKTAIEEKLDNVGFLRTRLEFLDHCFAENEVSEIWITFPDPHLKLKKVNRRLTSPFFLDMYKEIMQPDGIIHLKTDNESLYKFTLNTIEENKHELLFGTNDLYGSGTEMEVAEIRTFYESVFLAEGVKIKYVKFKLQIA